jgi:hypothetical protein
MIDYTSGILWLAAWPVLIYVSYRFVVLNINHFEENIRKEKEV